MARADDGPVLRRPGLTSARFCAAGAIRSRRAFLGMLGLGTAALLTGCGAVEPPAPPPLPPVPAPHPGPGREVRRGPAGGGRRIALTVDDGTSAECVAGYVDFALRSGMHLTFSPNGVLDGAWRPQARALAPLIATGQVQIINHTWSHPRLTELPDGRIRDEFERNDAWVVRLFGTTTRPWFRPPFGAYDARVAAVAGSLGYTRAAQWSGSFEDAAGAAPEVLMARARESLYPGAIVLGHANHPAVPGLLDAVLDLVRERRLVPVTLDEMFGTTRAAGA